MLFCTVIPTLDMTYGRGNTTGLIWSSWSHQQSGPEVPEQQTGIRGILVQSSLVPPNSPNLNPLNFSLWNYVAKRAQDDYHSTVSTLKTSVDWVSMPSLEVQKSCARFWTRVEAVVPAKGGINEK